MVKKILSHSTPCVPKFGALGLSESLELDMRIINEVWLAAILAKKLYAIAHPVYQNSVLWPYWLA